MPPPPLPAHTLKRDAWFFLAGRAAKKATTITKKPDGTWDIQVC
jgi:hypothetical protein